MAYTFENGTWGTYDDGIKGSLVDFHRRRESFTISSGDETTVLMAVIDLQTAGQNVTREAIKQKLGWNNKKHDIVKAVCDKHKIAVR